MKITIFTVIVVLLLLPLAVQASSEHWAQQEIDEMKAFYGVDLCGRTDAPAEIALQEKLWKLAKIDLTPVRELERYSVIKRLTEDLRLEEASPAEVPFILDGFEDVCNY